METLDILQLVLLLALLVAVAILLFSLRAWRHLHDKRDEDEATKKNELRLGRDRVSGHSRNALSRQLSRRMVEWIKKGRPTWGRPLG